MTATTKASPRPDQPITTGPRKISYGSSSVAIVTGGASGIGRALCELLAEKGCQVVIADLQHELASDLVGAIRKRGGAAQSHAVDVTDFDSFAALVRDTRQWFGRLDMLFNNAGIGIGGETHRYEIEDWNRTFDVHIHGVANGIQAAYPVMLSQGFGHIINTSSIAGLIPGPGLVAYTAAKHATFGLSQSLRIEAAAHGIRVSTLCPGVVQTPMIVDGGRYGHIVQPLPPGYEQWIARALRPMEPSAFARKVYARIVRNQGIVIVPTQWRAIWWLHRLSPALCSALISLAFGRVRKNLDLQ